MDPDQDNQHTIERRRGIPIFERGEDGTCVQRGLFNCREPVHLAPAEEIEIDGVGPIQAHRITSRVGGFAGHFLDLTGASERPQS